MTGIGYDESSTYRSLFGIDVLSAMRNKNTSVYCRIPFTATNSTEFTNLTLKMKYDDGFVAYLNGTKVASANAPANPTWNGKSTSSHSDSAAQQYVSFDLTPHIARSFADPRLRLIRQENRGLAGARNTGIAHARGLYVGFCDADDLWRPGKLAAHVAHLEARPEVGLSYSGSLLMDEAGRPTGLAQRPRLRGVTAAHVFRRNPVGNGSAAVMRRAALDAIAFRPPGEEARDWWFDETFRQSEDIECWLRLLLTTDWDIEGIRGLLTWYRIAPGGLSSALDGQYASWERMVGKLSAVAPAFVDHAHQRPAGLEERDYDGIFSPIVFTSGVSYLERDGSGSAIRLA